MTPSTIYNDYFDAVKVDYKIICSNRYNDVIDDSRYYCVRMNISAKSNKLVKMFYFIKFRNRVREYIRKHDFHKIIIWNENTAILLSSMLVKKYKKTYIVNVRDLIQQKNKTMFKIMSSKLLRCMDNALFCTTPSQATLKYYSRNTILLHNDINRVIQRCKIRTSFCDINKPIRLGYVGAVQGTSVETYKRLLVLFKNDKRFVLHFHGTGCNELLSYATDNEVDNVSISGGFPSDMTSEFLNNIDVILSYYNNGIVREAVSIKGCFGPRLYLPQICDAETYWGDLCEHRGLGFSVTTEHDLPDKLYKWYRNLNFNVFKRNCDEYNTYVKECNEIFYDKLSKFLKIIG